MAQSTMMTEGRNPNTWDLDTMSPLEIVTVMNADDRMVSEGVSRELADIAKAVSAAEESLLADGRLIYIGAGTSGRLGVLDASECPPTFGVDPETVIGIIAGGDRALRHAVEDAEDDKALGAYDLASVNLTANDLVVGIAASGQTPYVIGGLRYAQEVGCKTVAISCNAGSLISQYADIAIEVLVGPEILTGSTRLKAGTAQKMVLNMISTGAMVRTGKAYQNLMVNVVQTNNKLSARAESIVMDATGITREEARFALNRADNQVKLAIVMILADCPVETAAELLDGANGRVREAIRLGTKSQKN